MCRAESAPHEPFNDVLRDCCRFQPRGIVGVMAEAYLYVDLDNVARIVNRVVQTLDRNPQILIQVLKTVDTAVTSITGQPPRQPNP